ncbi:MAG: threonine/serine dehydratase [Myxococcota bacterium]
MTTPIDVNAARQRIRGIVRHTPLDPVPELGLGHGVFAKLELMQPTGSFKVRGALARLTRLSEAERARGVLTVSAGNHGLAVAWGATRLGIKATVVVPRSAALAKVERIRSFPVTLLSEGAGYDEAERWARKRAQETGQIFVSPYNDSEVVAGQGTVGLEIAEDLPEVDVIIAPAGGGGLVAGLCVALSERSRRVEIIPVEPEASPTLSRALEMGRIVQVEEETTLADGLAGNIEEGSITFPLIAAHTRRVELVTEDEIRAALRRGLDRLHLVLEGSAAVALAGAEKLAPALADKRVAIVLTGRNIGTDVLLASIAAERGSS